MTLFVKPGARREVPRPSLSTSARSGRGAVVDRTAGWL